MERPRPDRRRRPDRVGGATHEVVDRLFREEQGRAVATLIRVLGDFDLAEEAVQEAFITALETWPERGVPGQPGRLDHDHRAEPRDRPLAPPHAPAREDRAARPGVAIEAELAAIEPVRTEDPMPIADDRLRLIFTCCHPALAMDARVALTLRTLGGLTTPEIARAFLVPEPTLAQRLVRAKKKIRDAGIPYRVPPTELLPERLDGVLRVLYLVFNEGYAASSGDALVRRELSAEAIRLTRIVVSLLPDEPEATGLLALMLLHDARRDARTDADGGWSCSTRRIARSGTTTGSPRVRRPSSGRSPSGGPGRTRSRPRSPPCMTRRRPPPRPTGPRSPTCIERSCA